MMISVSDKRWGLSEQLEAARARCLSFSLAYLRLLRAVYRPVLDLVESELVLDPTLPAPLVRTPT